MRKLLIVFITACMLFNITAYADYEQKITPVETKIEFLKKHNIINGYNDGNLYLDNYITRAEFCKIIATATGITSDKYNNGGWLFLDVPENHWSNKYVYYCLKYGYIGGVTQNGDIYFVDLNDEKIPVAVTKGETALPYKTAPVNLFEPDEYITWQDALKILVNVLGYDPMAQARGGYPLGYVTIAKQIGVTEDEFNAGDYLKRQSAVDIIYKSLFTPFLIQDNTDSSNAESANYVIADGSGDIELKTLYKLYFE